MKITLKTTYHDKFMKALESDQTFSLAQKRQIASLLSVEAVEVHDENFKKLTELYKELTINNEKTRSQFIGMVNFIEKSTKIIVDSFKRQSFIKIEPKLGGKNTMVGRTAMVTDMVKYLNSLNELVINFYKDVYQIDKISDKEQEKEKIQASLF